MEAANSANEAVVEVDDDAVRFEDLTVDDDLPILERVVRYSRSQIALQRLVHVKMLAETAEIVGYVCNEHCRKNVRNGKCSRKGERGSTFVLLKGTCLSVDMYCCLRYSRRSSLPIDQTLYPLNPLQATFDTRSVNPLAAIAGQRSGKYHSATRFYTARPRLHRLHGQERHQSRRTRSKPRLL
jgi:hypothetical protein